MTVSDATESLAFIGTSDFSGLVRGKSIPWRALERRLGRGVGLSPRQLLQSPYCPAQEIGMGELVLVPDSAVRASIPVADAPDIVLLLGDLLEVDGAPWECCPRHFLRRGLAALHAEFGLTLLAGFEQGIGYTGAGARTGPAYSLEALRRQGGFGGRLLAALRANKIMPDKFLAASGCFEVAPAPAQGVAASDQALLVRELARAVAGGLGQRATLAPGPGPSARIHWSVLDEAGRPATYDESGMHGLSEEAEQIAAGMLHHMPALLALTGPSAPSFLRHGAGTTNELGLAGRSGPLRLCPLYATAEESAAAQLHLEYRLSDAAANPYLALGGLVWAGLDGLRRRRRIADVVRTALPASLGAAIEAFEESVSLAEWLGPVLREAYLRLKRTELDALAGLDADALCGRAAAVY